LAVPARPTPAKHWPAAWQPRGCAVENGYRFVDTYHPVSRFWTFQFIESGIFVGLSIAVLAVAVWWILRRTA
jgi:hypothetical protein